MAMAVGGVNQALTVAGLRTHCGLMVEAGDCRDLHHAAVLIGYGAGAVCPWLVLETAQSVQAGMAETEGVDGERLTLKAFEAGLAKVMSKMGISVVDSYRSAHLFDILGLHATVVEKCFFGTPAPLSGIGFEEIERRLRASWGVLSGLPGDAMPATAATTELPDLGWVRFRKAEGAEPHLWQPPTVKALQTVVGSARNVAPVADVTAQFAVYSRGVDVHEAVRVRDLLEIRPAGAELAKAEVEGAESLCHRFCASAMSLGSLSPEAHQTVTAAMKHDRGAVQHRRGWRGSGGVPGPRRHRAATDRSIPVTFCKGLAAQRRQRPGAVAWPWRRRWWLRRCM